MKKYILIFLLLTTPAYAGIDFGGLNGKNGFPDHAMFGDIEIPMFTSIQQAINYGAFIQGNRKLIEDLKAIMDSMQEAIDDIKATKGHMLPVDRADLIDFTVQVPYYKIAIERAERKGAIVGITSRTLTPEEYEEWKNGR